MKIHLPDEIRHYESDLRFFIDLMIRKLHINRHKGFGDKVTLETALGLLEAEMDELKEALGTQGQFQASMEAVDVSNMAFIIALITLRMTRKEFENNSIREGSDLEELTHAAE